ncbi:hypothetical protein JOM56_011828 [Amanita muscaria]
MAGGQEQRWHKPAIQDMPNSDRIGDSFMFMPGIASNLIIIRIGEQRAKGEDGWVDSRDASNASMPSELLNVPDMSTQGEMGQDNHERMDEGGAMEINETDAGEIMEVDRRQS